MNLNIYHLLHLRRCELVIQCGRSRGANYVTRYIERVLCSNRRNNKRKGRCVNSQTDIAIDRQWKLGGDPLSKALSWWNISYDIFLYVVNHVQALTGRWRLAQRWTGLLTKPNINRWINKMAVFPLLNRQLFKLLNFIHIHSFAKKYNNTGWYIILALSAVIADMNKSGKECGPPCKTIVPLRKERLCSFQAYP